MNPIILGALIDAITKIVTRHMDNNNGVAPTTEEVKAQLQTELAAANTEIADWFRENNLPVPE